MHFTNKKNNSYVITASVAVALFTFAIMATTPAQAAPQHNGIGAGCGGSSRRRSRRRRNNTMTTAAVASILLQSDRCVLSYSIPLM
jgi:hypothetical protein